jgi:hypothetical protein
MRSKKKKPVDLETGLYLNTGDNAHKVFIPNPDGRLTKSYNESFSIVLRVTPLASKTYYGVILDHGGSQANHSWGILIGYTATHFLWQVKGNWNLDTPLTLGTTYTVTIVNEPSVGFHYYLDGKFCVTLTADTGVFDTIRLGDIVNSTGGNTVETIIHQVAIFNTQIDKVNGVTDTTDIHTMQRMGNYIPPRLHPYVVEHLTCQEKEGNRLYSCVEQYNYAKFATPTQHGLVQYGTEELLVLNADGSITAGNNAANAANVGVSATVSSIQIKSTYTIKLVAQMPVGSQCYIYVFGRHIFTLDWANTPQEDNNTVQTFTLSPNSTANAPELSDKLYYFYCPAGFAGKIKSFQIYATGFEPNIHLTANHADLIGYTSADLEINGTARKDVYTKQTALALALNLATFNHPSIYHYKVEGLSGLPTGNRTVSFYFYTEKTNYHGNIFGYGIPNAPNIFDVFCNYGQINIHRYGDCACELSNSPNRINPFQLYFVSLVLTNTGTDRYDIQLYLDGALINTINIPINTIVDGTVLVGAGCYSPINQWNFSVGEIQIWDIARTQTQLKSDMYGIQDPTSEPNLKAYLKQVHNTLTEASGKSCTISTIGSPTTKVINLPAIKEGIILAKDKNVHEGKGLYQNLTSPFYNIVSTPFTIRLAYYFRPNISYRQTLFSVTSTVGYGFGITYRTEYGAICFEGPYTNGISFPNTEGFVFITLIRQQDNKWVMCVNGKHATLESYQGQDWNYGDTTRFDIGDLGPSFFPVSILIHASFRRGESTVREHLNWYNNLNGGNLPDINSGNYVFYYNANKANIDTTNNLLLDLSPNKLNANMVGFSANELDPTKPEYAIKPIKHIRERTPYYKYIYLNDATVDVLRIPLTNAKGISYWFHKPAIDDNTSFKIDARDGGDAYFYGGLTNCKYYLNNYTEVNTGDVERPYIWQFIYIEFDNLQTALARINASYGDNDTANRDIADLQVYSSALTTEQRLKLANRTGEIPPQTQSRYLFENNVNDSIGTAHGSVLGAPTYKRLID